MAWDLKSGRKMRTLVVHTIRGEPDWDDAIALSPDGQAIVSASDNNMLKIWDLVSGSLISSFTGDSSMLSCAFSSDGRTIVAGEASGRVHFLRLEGLPAGKGAKPQS